MAKKRPRPGRRRAAAPNPADGGASRGSRFTRRRTAIRARRLPGGAGWELVHPRCARERAEDLEEVQAMLDAGETEIARDELRWLLEDCHDLLDGHRLLGELALEEHDLRLARAHFGYAFEIGYSALPPAAEGGRVGYDRPANRSLLESAKGLAWCLHELGKPRMALAVARQLLAWDDSDPLGVRPWCEKWPGELAAAPPKSSDDEARAREAAPAEGAAHGSNIGGADHDQPASGPPDAGSAP